MAIRGLTYKLRPPKIGELRSPVVFAKREIKPDGTFGANMDLTTQANAWARVVYSSAKHVGEDNEETGVTHEFHVRAEQGAIDADDLVVLYNDRLFTVLGTRRLDPKGLFHVVYANDEGPLANYNWDDTATEEEPNDPDAVVPQFTDEDGGPVPAPTVTTPPPNAEPSNDDEPPMWL